MSGVTGSIILSKEEFKAKKSLEEAQKRGLISITESDSSGNQTYSINAPRGTRS